MRALVSVVARAAAHVVAAALLVVPSTADASAVAPRCYSVAFSPGFARDRTIFCLTNSEDAGVRLYVSGDGGRTWSPRAKLTGRYVQWVEPVVSPAYPEDPTVFVVGAEAMWVSRDAGRTFGAEGEGPILGALTVTPYVEEAPVPHAALADAGIATVGAGIYDSLVGRWRPVLGTPTANHRFIVPPDYATTRRAVAIGAEGGLTVAWQPVLREVIQAYACEADFTCVTPVFDFGKVFVLHAARIADGDEVVVTEPRRPVGVPPGPPSTRRVWRSRDYGRTWQRWTSLESLLIAARDGVRIPEIVITKSPDAPRRLFAQTVHRVLKSSRAPAVNLWRSDDDGRTWRRIGYAWGPKQRHAGRGTLPWNDTGDTIALARPWVSAQAGGQLYAIGARRVGGRVTNQRLWCSRDLGRTWRPTC